MTATLLDLRPATPDGATPPAPRLEPLDAVRGAAMLFVFLAHFSSGYFGTMGAATLERRVGTPGYMAIPTFVMVSGLLAGWMFSVRPERFDRFAHHLRRKALFLLTISHGLFVLAVVPRVLAGGQTLAEIIVTDTLGVAMLVGPFLVPRLRAPSRIALAAAVYVASWAVVLLVHPESDAGRAVEQALVGWVPGEPLFWTYCVPIVPWFAVYLASSVAGEWVARVQRREGLGLVAARFASFGVAAVLLTVAQRELVRLLRHRLPGVPAFDGDLAHALSAPWQMIPPGAGFILLYGGGGVLLAALVFRAMERAPDHPAMRVLAMMGRASLFLFVVQFFVFYGALPALRLPYSPLWPLLFAALVAPLVAAAHWWDRRGYNRLLAVPLPSRRDWPRTAAAVACAALLLVLALRLTNDSPRPSHADAPAPVPVRA